jgi:hypothetical protein
MSKWKIMIAVIALSLAVAGYSWVHAQPAKPAPAKVLKLTPEDYQQIRQLYADYSYNIDQGTGEGFANLFTDDGEFTASPMAPRTPAPGAGPGGNAAPAPPPAPAKAPGPAPAPLTGRAALIRTGSNPGTRHDAFNILITPTADGAESHCYVMIYIERTQPGFLNGTGVYDDILVKTPQGWKFKKRHLWRDTDPTSPYAYQNAPVPPGAPGTGAGRGQAPPQSDQH